MLYEIWYKPGGGGGALDFHVDGGGGAAGGRKPDPVAMRSVHKKIHPVTVDNIPYKKFAYAYPVAILHRRWCPDRGPVINIVGWEPLGSNPVINGVVRQ